MLAWYATKIQARSVWLDAWLVPTYGRGEDERKKLDDGSAGRSEPCMCIGILSVRFIWIAERSRFPLPFMQIFGFASWSHFESGAGSEMIRELHHFSVGTCVFGLLPIVKP